MSKKLNLFVTTALIFVLSVATVFADSPETCPEQPIDNGVCDTIYYEPWPADTILEGNGPYFVRVPIYVTNDMVNPEDSIAAFLISLCYTHSNPTKYCSLSGYWNNNKIYPFPIPGIDQSIFRHITDPVTGDTLVYNRMMTLSEDFSGREWDYREVVLDGSSYFRFCMVETGEPDQAWWEGSRVLLATMTFKLEDSMQICMDTCFWSPSYTLVFVNSLADVYVPRLGTPHFPESYQVCFNVHLGGLHTFFSAEPESGFAPLKVQFTDLSTGDPTNWYWDFGDQTTSTEQHPIHNYNNKGIYDVMLITSNGVKYDTLIKEDYIAVFDTLFVDFSANPTQGHNPLTVSFQSLCDPVPYNVTWYFGDGGSSNELNPVHQYNDGGIYDVKLVAELFGYKDSLIKDDLILVSDIRAEFSADKRCGSDPLEVTFSDGSTGIFPITNWHWDFGDGGTSYEQDPTHQYENTGVFDVRLIVSDGIGVDTLIKEEYITTQDSVSADFGGYPTSGSSPLAVMFEPTLEGTANQYFWDFGDGDTSVLKNPIHTYTTQGLYDVKLKVKLELDDCNQVDSVIKEEYIVVNDLEAKFTANPTAGLAPLLVQFIDGSSGTPDSWFWDFGDGNTSTTQSPFHEYDTAGVYDVFLRVGNSISYDSLLKLDYILVDTLFTELFAEIYDAGGARPGFNLWFFYVWTNLGTYPAENCTLKILLPQQMFFYSLIGFPYSYVFSGDTIIASLGTINPSEWPGGYVWADGLLPTTVEIGDTLVTEMWLSSSTLEQNYANNYVLYRLVVIGSIDPNDKLAYPEGEGKVHAIDSDQRLEYVVRFENKPEATAEAIYVRVVDTLDQDLNWGSLAFGASSHPEPCDYEFNPYTGVITWFCDSIMLPPNVNPPEGEGYFTFSISPKPNLPAETEISNTAWIRFDYNAWLQAPEEGPVTRVIEYSHLGDVNLDDIVNLSDVIFLLNYLFRNGPPPIPLKVADASCNGKVDLGDAIFLLSYLFRSGPPPDC